MMSADEVRKMIRSRAEDIGTMRALARAWKVSPAYLSDVINGNREPGPRILRALGLRKSVIYSPRDPAASRQTQP